MSLSLISAWLISPCLPSNGIHEIMRMMFEVQNGTVHIRNSPSRQQRAANVEHQEIGNQEADQQT